MTDTKLEHTRPSLNVPTDASMRDDPEWDEQDANLESFRIVRRVMAPLSVRPIPFRLIRRYALLAALRADIDTLDDGRLYGSIRGFSGVWATASDRNELLNELEDGVYGWALLKVEDGDGDLPFVGGIDLNRI